MKAHYRETSSPWQSGTKFSCSLSFSLHLFPKPIVFLSLLNGVSRWVKQGHVGNFISQLGYNIGNVGVIYKEKVDSGREIKLSPAVQRFSESWKSESAVFIIIMSCLLCFETNSPRPKAREAKQPIPWGDVSAPPSLCVLPSRSPELSMLQEEQENAWWGRQAKEGQMAPYKWPVTAWINTRQEPPRNRVQAYL